MLSPFFGFSGIILNVASSKLDAEFVVGCVAGGVTGGVITSGCCSVFGAAFPMEMSFPFASIVFQFIPGLATSVFIPNFTDSPWLTGFSVENTSIPCAVLVPVQSLSVLNDLNAPLSWPSHIFTVLIWVLPLFSNSIMVVFSKLVLLAGVSANALPRTTPENKIDTVILKTTKLILLILPHSLYFLLTLIAYPFVSLGLFMSKIL